MRSTFSVCAVALAGLFFVPHVSLAGGPEDSRCEMRFAYSSFVLGRLTSVSYQVSLEGAYSESTGFTPMSGFVVCRNQKFVLTPEEAHRLFDFVLSSEIFSLRDQRTFERGFDRLFIGDSASAKLDYRGVNISVTRRRASKSVPFRTVRTEIEGLLKGKEAEPSATDNPDDAQRLREDH